MNTIQRRTLLAACASAALPLRAQTKWPAQPIRLIVPFPPAGGTDLISRLIADRITGSEDGWSFVVDNRAGAGGNIGIDAVAKSRPDGYTIGMGQTSNLAINPSLYKRMPYNVGRDLSLIALVAGQPLVLVVRADAPYKRFEDLMAAMKAKPGALTMASPGGGSVGHLSGELLGVRTGVKFLHVPYKGAGPAVNDLLGGQVDWYFSTPQAALPMIQVSKLRALAVTSLNRVEILRDVPTLDESGVRGFEASDWKAVVGPAGMPADVVRRLNEAVNAALARPEMVERLRSEGGVPLPMTPEKFKEFLAAENRRWGEAVRVSGATID